MLKYFSPRSRVAVVMVSIGALLYADPLTPGSSTKVATPPSSAPTSASSGVWAQLKALEQQYKANLAGIDSQINPLRQQIQTAEGSLKPLQAQRETMVTQYDDQRASLLDQVEPGFLSAYQTKKQGLESAKSQHDQAITTANQQFTAARQQINAQFDATVKGLKKK